MSTLSTFTVLGLDGSTDVTGAALVQFDRGGVLRYADKSQAVLLATSFGAKANESDALRARITRIAQTRQALETEIAPFSSLDFSVAYEGHTWRGTDASEALAQAAGAYLSIPFLLERPIYDISPSSAKAAWNGSKMPRAEAKKQVVLWARHEFGLNLAPGQDAIADALAVCMAAWSEWRQNEMTGSQMILFGPGSRKGRK